LLWSWFTMSVWEDSEYLRPSAKAVNPLLVRPAVGKVRKSTYDVPNDKIFGMIDEKDVEGAKEVIHSWRIHEPNKAAQAGKDFIRLNSIAVKAGCTSSKEHAEFRQTVDVRLDTRPTKKAPSPPPVPENGFGYQNYGPIENMSDVLSHAYQREWVMQQQTINEKAKGDKGHKKLPAPTKASQAHARKRSLPEKKEFKMKRFASVPSKVKPFLGS